MSSLDTKTARLYARSLFDSVEPVMLDDMNQALKEFTELWNSSAELRDVMDSPVVTTSEKFSALKELSSKVTGSNEKFSNFICLLQKNKRLSGIENVAESFDLMLAEYKKILSVTVTSAFEVPADEKQSLESALTAEHGSMARVHWERDPEILGGLKIQCGDKLLDGSIRSSLERLRSQLSA